MIRSVTTIYRVRCVKCNPITDKPEPIDFESAIARNEWINKHKHRDTKKTRVIFKWTEPRETMV